MKHHLYCILDSAYNWNYSGFLSYSVFLYTSTTLGFPVWLFGSDSRESICNAADPGLIPWSGRSPGERNGYPLQYSCLENSVDRRAWWATVHGILQARKLEWVAYPFSRGSSQPRDQTQISRIADFLPAKPQGKPKNTGVGSRSLLQTIFLTQESSIVGRFFTN